MVIDIHSHFVDESYISNLSQELGLTASSTDDGKTLYRQGNFTVAWSRTDMFDIDNRLREMDRKKIDVRVLSLSTPNVYPWSSAAQIEISRQVNDVLASICRAHPDRFVGLASLPLKDVDASLLELTRAIDELGLRGLAIGSNVDGSQMDEPQFERLWATIDALKLPVFEHPMFPSETANLQDYELPLRVGLIFDTTLVATRLIYSGIFERYPNIPYIMAHTGGAILMLLDRLDNGFKLFPDCRKHISQLPSIYAKRLYYDTTTFGAAALRLAIETVGADHLLFGTDDPFIDSDRTHVEKLGLSDHDLAAVLGGNARQLLKL